MFHALSFDIENWHLGYSLRGIPGWEEVECSEMATIERILKLLDEFDTKATFFVLGRLAEEQPGIVRCLHSEGHEIASHGHAHLPVPRHRPDSFREDLRRSIGVLEELTNERVSGHRAAGWSVTRECLWALDILKDEGLDYDSSVFPTGFHKYGFPGATLGAHLLPLPSGRSILEFPAQVLSIGPLKLPAAGGFYFRALPVAVSERALRQSEQRGEGGMVYLHAHDLDAAAPVVKSGLWLRLVRHHNLARAEAYLRRLLERFRFRPVCELAHACAQGR
jgi:polysaccharide deacetylase family protein (PEP-CTERM system associated)